MLVGVFAFGVRGVRSEKYRNDMDSDSEFGVSFTDVAAPKPMNVSREKYQPNTLAAFENIKESQAATGLEKLPID